LDDDDMDIQDSSPSSPVSGSSAKEPSTMLDPTYWTPEEVCCGTVFRGRCGEVVVDHRFYKPCHGRSTFKYPSRPESPVVPAAVKTVLGKDVDSSSDSGYDDYSSKDAKAAVEEEAPASSKAPAAAAPDCPPATSEVAPASSD
jgi:Protein Family FAM60A